MCVSSSAHQFASDGIPFDKLHDPKAYAMAKWYGYSKLANILYARELARRLKESSAPNNSQVYVNAIHPGVVNTELMRQFGTWVNWLLTPAKWLFMLTPEQGALTQLYAATDPRIEVDHVQGRYFVPIAKPSSTTKTAEDERLAKELWSYSEKLIREKLGPAVL